MATNKNSNGSDYQSWQSAARQQRREHQDNANRYQREDKIAEYVRNHPSASWAEAEYKTRGNS